MSLYGPAASSCFQLTIFCNCNTCVYHDSSFININIHANIFSCWQAPEAIGQTDAPTGENKPARMDKTGSIFGTVIAENDIGISVLELNMQL